MWILPKQLHTSPFVPDTAALISDSTEQSEICAQSLLARSKPSPARTWSQRWKRDSWTQHLSGRILKPSHGQTFVTAWTSCLAATRASRSQQPASASEPKTHDTSGLTYQPELLQCDQVSVSLKTSRDISALGYPTLSKTWADWVTERRGAWRARVNAARLISANESLCLLWPTPEGMAGGKTSRGGNRKDELLLNGMVRLHGQAAPASSSSLGSRQGLWPTASVCGNHNRIGASPTSGDGLATMVKQWGTPTAREHKSGRGNEQREYKEPTPMVERQQTGKLNSQWVTQLMGLPMGWVSPSCPASVIKNWPRFVTGWFQATTAPTSCDYLETALCRPAQSGRSEFFLVS